MSRTNPYQSPSADISNNSQETYQPKIFSTTGRIGRLRFIAYSMASYLIIIPFAILGGIISSFTNNPEILPVIIVIAYIPMIIYIFIVAKRRLNDINKSGWLSLVTLIPLIGIFFGLYIMLAKGNDGSNSFGPAPIANSTGVKLAAGFMLFIPILGIIAAVTLPAYQDYVERANQIQQP